MSNATDITFSSNPPSTPPQTQPLILTLVSVLLVFGTLALSRYGWRQSVLFLIGGLFGVSLYHASFGFSSAYRKLFVYRDARGVLAQLLMLAIATVLFAPILATGSVFGQAVIGKVAPVGVQNAIGAFLFGVGMQLANGCACGTLYTIGGGSTSMLLTLLTFCIGAFTASLTQHLWVGLPSLPPVSLGQLLGWHWAVLLQLTLFLVLALALRQWTRGNGENSLFKSLGKQENATSTLDNLLYGPWSLAIGAFLLALLNVLTLLIAGRPWGVTHGFTLWGAKMATILGWNPETSSFWSSGSWQDALSRSVFADVTSVMNMGIILGASLAAALAGKLLLKKPISWIAIAATLVGGFFMGYGALIAFGCNVGAYFSGIASTSLHGWLWIACALVGTGVGIRLRSLFQLPI
jgi:uncharacterized membrane protein YedE/YeeE